MRMLIFCMWVAMSSVSTFLPLFFAWGSSIQSLLTDHIALPALGRGRSGLKNPTWLMKIEPRGFRSVLRCHNHNAMLMVANRYLNISVDGWLLFQSFGWVIILVIWYWLFLTIVCWSQNLSIAARCFCQLVCWLMFLGLFSNASDDCWLVLS